MVHRWFNSIHLKLNSNVFVLYTMRRIILWYSECSWMLNWKAFADLIARLPLLVWKAKMEMIEILPFGNPLSPPGHRPQMLSTSMLDSPLDSLSGSPPWFELLSPTCSLFLLCVQNPGLFKLTKSLFLWLCYLIISSLWDANLSCWSYSRNSTYW